MSKGVSGRKVQRDSERWKRGGGQITHDLTGRLWGAFLTFILSDTGSS